MDLLRCMHQVAKGMEYLHLQGVLHGDLKGANVLVDDKRCLVLDFGQSEMRSEAYQLSGTPPPREFSKDVFVCVVLTLGQMGR